MFRFEVLVDHGETGNKCTIVPLRYRPDFTILRVPPDPVIKPLTAQLLLHPDGVSWQEALARLGTARSLAAVDCVWRRLEPLLTKIARPLPLMVRIPADFVTVYPRKSKATGDPVGGLATIEALFIGAALSGHWDGTLLSEYLFGDQFLAANDPVFRRHGVIPPPRSASVFRPRYPSNSVQRRIARGRQPQL